MMRFDTIVSFHVYNQKYNDTILQTCQNLILWYDLIQFYKHVQTCQNSMIQFDAILKIRRDLSQQYHDTIWYDSTNISRLVKILWYDLMQFYKHVQTCHNIMIRFDTILQTFPDLSQFYDSIWYNSTDMSRLVIMLRYNSILTFLNTNDAIWYNHTILQTCLDLSVIIKWWNSLNFG